MSNWQDQYPQLMKQQRYEILRQIGEGGMATVFHCKDKDLDDIVALKIMKPDLVDSEKMILRFKQEIKIARRISHRNICRIYDFGSISGLFYIVMEYLDGVPLSSVIRMKNAIPEDKKLSVAIKILQGLEAAHEEKIVHRDLKPSNIMLIKYTEPVITDFGLARYFGPKGVSTDHSFAGTPAYMSPEQIIGHDVDHRADIYAFGVILYELLTMNYPFKSKSLFEILYSHVNDQPIPPRELNESIPINIENIILKCLEKKPEERYQTVSKIISDIMISFWSKKTAAQPDKKKKVLIADDEPSIRKMLVKMFQILGMDGITAENGREAVELAFKEKPDLICLDIMMPEMTGLEAAEIMLSNSQTAEIPIVILSAKADNEYMLYSRQLGIKDYLTKPIRVDDLRQRLEFWLQKG